MTNEDMIRLVAEVYKLDNDKAEEIVHMIRNEVCKYHLSNKERCKHYHVGFNHCGYCWAMQSAPGVACGGDTGKCEVD